MKEVNHFHKRFLCLFLTSYILKCDTCLFLNINLGFALTDAHDASASAHTAHKSAEQNPQKNHRYHNGQNIQRNADHSIILDIWLDLHILLPHQRQKLCIIRHLTCIISKRYSIFIFFLRCDLPCRTRILHRSYLICLQHIQEFIICNLLGCCLCVLIVKQCPHQDRSYYKDSKHQHILCVFRCFAAIVISIPFIVWGCIVIHLSPPCA